MRNNARIDLVKEKIGQARLGYLTQIAARIKEEVARGFGQIELHFSSSDEAIKFTRNRRFYSKEGQRVGTFIPLEVLSKDLRSQGYGVSSAYDSEQANIIELGLNHTSLFSRVPSF